MSDHNHPTNDVTEHINAHNETPSITDNDDLLQHENRVYIIHNPGEVTRIGITELDDGTIQITGIVRITTERPRITPADDVISIGRITHINHGPGRETRVIE